MYRGSSIGLGLVFFFVLSACQRQSLPALPVGEAGVIGNETGNAMVYPHRYNRITTANGEKYDSSKFTASHRSLAFGSQVTVINTINLKTVTVRINDRGPYVPDRIIGLSTAAARQLGLAPEEIVKVKLRYKD